MNVWRLMLHHEKEQYDKNEHPEIRNHMLVWSLNEEHPGEGRIALGWGRVSDIPKCASPEKCIQLIKTEISNKYGDTLPAQNKAHGGYSLHNFCHVMQNGDLVILVGKNSRREAIMRIGDKNVQDGNYFRKAKENVHDENLPPDDYQHQRRATKVGNHKEAKTLWEDWKKYGLSREGGPRCPLVRLIFPTEYHFSY